jgi:hypothetical protein
VSAPGDGVMRDARARAETAHHPPSERITPSASLVHRLSLRAAAEAVLARAARIADAHQDAHQGDALRPSTGEGVRITPEGSYPCVVCGAETGAEMLFCASCWAARLERSPRLCRHELVAWDAARRAVFCATCRRQVLREGERFVLAPVLGADAAGANAGGVTASQLRGVETNVTNVSRAR